MRSYPDVDELASWDETDKVSRCDFYLRLLSSAGMLGTTATTIPQNVPYLRADSTLAEHWRQELAGIEGFKIGIVWQGSREFISDRWRSIPLACFAPLARLPGVRLISLQKGFGSEQIAAVDFSVVDLSNRLDEAAGAFMDTAAVIRNLDLVIDPGYGGRTFGRGPGGAGVAGPAGVGRLALAATSRRFPLVSHHAAVPPDRFRPVAGSFRAHGSCPSGKPLGKGNRK